MKLNCLWANVRMAVFVHVSTWVWALSMWVCVCLCVCMLFKLISFQMALKCAIVEILMQKKGSDYKHSINSCVHWNITVDDVVCLFAFPFSMLFISLSLSPFRQKKYTFWRHECSLECSYVRYVYMRVIFMPFFHPYIYIVYTQAINICIWRKKVCSSSIWDEFTKNADVFIPVHYCQITSELSGKQWANCTMYTTHKRNL